MKIKIPHRFPGLNEIIAKAKLDRPVRKNSRQKARFPYSKFKEKYTFIAFDYFCAEPKFEGPVNISFTWYGNRKRDPDNIMVGQKFILDGMVKAGTIKNDTQKYIKELNHSFEYSKTDYVIVEISEA